jgi:general secretion pathway protein G
VTRRLFLNQEGRQQRPSNPPWLCPGFFDSEFSWAKLTKRRSRSGIINDMKFVQKPALALGFTLIELLVVIAIIGILVAVVLASLSDARQQSLAVSAQSEMRSIQTAMELMYNDVGLYPHQRSRYCPPRDGSNNEVDLSLPSSGLIATDGSYSGWRGPYISDVLDPWGMPYFLDEDYYCTAGAVGCNGHISLTADRAVLVSCGPDKLIGQDPSNGTPNNGPGCAYNDDNIVYVLCSQ